MSKYRKSFTDINGRRHFVRANTKAELEQKIGQLKEQIRQGNVTSKRNITVSRWADGWIETYKPEASRSYFRQLSNILHKFCNAYGDIPLNKLKSRDIQKYVNSLSMYTKGTIDTHCLVLAKFFQTAEDSDIIQKSPFRGIMRPKGKAPRNRRALTNQEQADIINIAENHDFGLFMLIMLYCGCRPMEVAALKWSDVDLIHARLSITKAVKADGEVGKPKTKAGIRTVPIPEALLRKLEAAEGDPDEYVTTYKTGCRWNRFYVNQEWQSVKSILTQWHGSVADDLVLYDLRHTYCTNLQAAGVPINVAKELMGHTNISTTAAIYTHQSERATADAENKINNFYRANSVPDDNKVLEFKRFIK